MNYKKLSNLFLLFLFLLAGGSPGFSQTTNYNSPVNWVSYSVESVKASFLLPKLPVVVDESNRCKGEQTFAYGSYADGAAYVVRITVKIDVPKYCANRREFDETNFENRVSQLKSLPLNLKEREKGSSKSNEVILYDNNRIHKLVADLKNNRWFEFTVIGADETKTEVKNFLASLKTGKKSAGTEIGAGADRVLGDEINDGGGNSAVVSKPETSSNKPQTEGVLIALKPRANYTEMARRNQTQGKVVLRVTFSESGGIGAISVVSGLSDGLTEQAIAAARRILFIPAKRGGVRYSVVKPVEYTFSIY